MPARARVPSCCASLTRLPTGWCTASGPRARAPGEAHPFQQGRPPTLGHLVFCPPSPQVPPQRERVLFSALGCWEGLLPTPHSRATGCGPRPLPRTCHSRRRASPRRFSGYAPHLLDSSPPCSTPCANYSRTSARHDLPVVLSCTPPSFLYYLFGLKPHNTHYRCAPRRCLTRRTTAACFSCAPTTASKPRTNSWAAFVRRFELLTAPWPDADSFTAPAC